MRCRVFTCWLNLDWFLFIYERFIVKNPLRFCRQKICSIYYLHFSFEKYVPFQILKDLSVENLETISTTLLSKFFLKSIDLESFGIPISSFSPSTYKIHFKKKCFEGNLPFIPPNILISWVRSVSTNTCNW